MSKEMNASESMFRFFRKATGPVFPVGTQPEKPENIANTPSNENAGGIYAFNGPYQTEQMTENQRSKFFPPRGEDGDDYEGGGL